MAFHARPKGIRKSIVPKDLKKVGQEKKAPDGRQTIRPKKGRG